LGVVLAIAFCGFGYGETLFMITLLLFLLLWFMLRSLCSWEHGATTRENSATTQGFNGTPLAD
jgi:hypothetical protein